MSRSTRSRFLGVLFVLCLVAALWAAPAFAADGTWLGTTGNWSDPGTWLDGTIADGTGFTANFTGVDIMADQTITLDSARIIGNITFTDADTASNNLTISGANTLLLDVTTGSPTIDVTQSGRTLTIDSLIGGSDGLTKSGAGTLILSGANNYIGTTTISAGELVATTGSTFTPFSTGTVDIGANILTLSPSSTAANSTLANTLTGTGTLNINPAAGRNMTLSGNLSGFTGTVNVASNTGVAKLTTGSVTLGSGAIVNIASGATWFMNGGTHSGITANIYGTGNSENLGALRMDGGTISNTSSVVLKADGSVGGNSGTGTINAVISDGGGGFSLTKVGAGTTVLGAANTYTGATIIDKGTLTLANVSALTNTSAITMAGGTTLRPDVVSAVVNAPITVGNSGTTVTINAPSVVGSGGTNAVPFTLNGAISGAGNVTFSGIQNTNAYGTIILKGASDYAGSTLVTCTGSTNTQIEVRLGIDNALPPTTVLTLDGGNGTGSGRLCQLNLNGHDQTLAGLTNVTRTLRTQRVKNTSDTPATLTVNNDNDYTFSGKLGDGGANFGLTKSGSGTWTISGVNTYSGATSINAGTLSLTGSLTGGTAISTSGTGILNESATGVFSGAESITQGSSGTSILSGVNTYSGATKITAGILSLGNTNSMQNSALDTANSITGDEYNGLRTTVTSLTMGGLTGDKNLADVFTTTTGGYTALTNLTLNPGTDVTNSYTGAIANGAAAGMILTKTGQGTQVLAGTNTYTGATTISAGTLRFAKQASLYNNNTIGGGWTAANIKVASTGTLALNVGGTDEFTTADVTTLLTALGGANGSSTTGFAAGSFIGFDTTNASGGTFTVADAIADSTGAGGGAIGVTKLGTNTLVLSGLSATAANNYSGTTTIDAGTLAISANDPSFTGGLTFGSANASTTVGTLDLSTSSATYAGPALVRTNNAAANTVLIGDGKTLTLNGGLTMGYDAAGGSGATQSNLTASGAGSLVITGTAIAVSVNQAATNQAYWSEPTLDVSGLGAFSTNVTNFNVGVGNNSQGPGHVLLSNTANSIDANTLTVGDTGVNNGRGTSELTLGTGTNVIRADTINIGRNKASGPGVVKFVSQTAGSSGTVTIADKAGTGRANIDIANQLGNSTSGGAIGTLDLRGHVATVSAGTVTVGAVAAGSGAGGPNGTLSFDAGTFDANALNLAPKSGNGTGTARATVNIGGGSVTVNTAFTLGSQVSGGFSVATLNLTGGTLSSAASILDGGGNTTSKITLDGGTLNMNGNAIGGATAIDTLEFKSGGLQNVSQINDGATGLTKIATGTLVLTGTNTYTGGTTVNGGTLLLSGAFNMPTTGTLQVNAGGNFSLADGTASNTTTTAALGLASGATLTFDWNAGSVDTLTSTAAATTAGTVGIIINNTSPSGSGGMLISSASGGLTTAGGTQYFLVNNTDYTAPLTVTDTDVSIGAQSPATALTDAYWKGGQLTGGALGAMAFSSGTSSNWASDAAGTSAAGVVPGGSAVNVIFGATGATEQASVTTGADMNLGSITFNDSAAVTIGGSNTITLNSTSATAATSSGSGTTVTPGSAITVTSSANAANAINANIQLAADQTWNVASTKTLTVGGSVGGTGTLTLADAGTLILTGANAYTGATTISAGTMQLGDGTTGKDGTIGNTSGVTNNAALVFNQFGSSSAGYAIGGTGTVTKLGAGTQALSGTNTYIGATTISAGTLQFAKEVSLYNNNTAGTGWTAANIVVGNGGTLALNVGGTDEFTTTDVTTLLTALGGANGTTTAGFAAGSKIAFDTTGGTFTVADLIADSTGSGGGAIGLTKLGTNTLTLTNANTYSGVTTISAGTLALALNADPNNPTLGTLGTAAAGTVVQSGAALKLAGGNYTLNEALTLSGTGVGAAQSTYGALLLNQNNGTFTFNGPITLDGGAAINTYLAGYANVQIAQAIGGTGDLTLRASAAGNGGALYRLQGQSNYDGNTILSTNDTNASGITVQNEIDDALPTTTVLTIAAGASKNAIYRLNGYNQTVAGMQISGTGTLNAIVGGSATLSTLTVNNSGNYTFAGKLGNTGTNENNLALVKSGVGTLTLDSNTNTFTGDITINRGTLVAAVATPNNTAPATALGNATSSARTITVNTDGTLEFDAGNVMSHNFASNNVPSLVVAGGTVTNGGSATNNALGGVTLNGGTLTATVGSGSGYGSWNLNGTVASTGASLISSTASVPIALSAVSVDGNTTTFDVQSGTLTVSAALGQVTASGDERTSGLTKTGDGTLALTAANIYTGNTTVSAGTLSLANDAQLKFVIGANGVNNKITGTGTLDLAGDFNFDLTAAVVALGNTWKIVDNAALAETYQSSFSVIGFTGGEGAGVLWTKPIIDSLMKWEFRESTGELRTFVPGDTNEDGIADAADYIAVKTNFGMPSGATKLQGDLDGDLDVDWDDLQELMNAMATRSVGGAPPAPEPATLGLLAIGALALLRRRRK